MPQWQQYIDILILYVKTATRPVAVEVTEAATRLNKPKKVRSEEEKRSKSKTLDPVANLNIIPMYTFITYMETLTFQPNVKSKEIVSMLNFI